MSLPEGNFPPRRVCFSLDLLVSGWAFPGTSDPLVPVTCQKTQVSQTQPSLHVLFLQHHGLGAVPLMAAIDLAQLPVPLDAQLPLSPVA